MRQGTPDETEQHGTQHAKGGSACSCGGEEIRKSLFQRIGMQNHCESSREDMVQVL